jgi:hypothetical protein
MSEETNVLGSKIDIPGPSLVKKLCQVGNAVGWIKKRGRNTFQNYDYATEADIVAELRGELFKRNVFIFWHVIKNERVDIQIESSKGIRKTALTHVDVEWTFVDGDTGEKWTVMVPGVGEDSGDKGLYKAFTGAEKYFLMKSFLLPTGNDPEADPNTHEASQEVLQDKLAGKRPLHGDKSAVPASNSEQRAFKGRIELDWANETSPIVRGDLGRFDTLQDKCLTAKFVDGWWHIEPRDAENLRNLCEFMQFELVELTGHSGGSPQASIHPKSAAPDQRDASPSPGPAADTVNGTITAFTRATTQTGKEYATVLVKQGNRVYTLSSWHRGLNEHLEANQGRFVEALVVSKGKYRNLVGLKSVGTVKFDEDGVTPIIDKDREAGGQLWPNSK